MATPKKLRRQSGLPMTLLGQRLKLAEGDLRFRRHAVIGPYFADFLCPEAKVAIEIDPADLDEEEEAANVRREWYMAAVGIELYTVVASDVLRNPNDAAGEIVRFCQARARPS